MRTQNNGRSIGLTLEVAVCVLGVACAPSDAAEKEQQSLPAAETAERVVNVEVTLVELTSFTDYIRITGEVEAFNDVAIPAEEAGVVQKILVEKGRWVSVGQPIIKLDDAVLSAQVDDARAAAALAQEQFQRRRQLWEDEGVGSEMTFLQAKYAAQRSAAQLRVLEARLARTVIRSPVDGMLDDRYLDVGEMAGVGTRVARVVTTRRVKVTGGVPERFAASVGQGDMARVTFDILPGREFEGRIRFVGSSVDPNNRTFPIEIWLDNPEGLVKAHMVANVQVVRSSRTEVVVVPQNVVVRSADGYLVFVTREEEGVMFASARPVKVGPSYNNWSVIEEGLVEGDVVITLGHQLVDDGSRIRIVNAKTVAQ